MIATPAMDRDRLRRVVERVLPIALEEARLLDEIRDALEQGDETAALAMTRRLCGLPSAERVP